MLTVIGLGHEDPDVLVENLVRCIANSLMQALLDD
jgi:hypothetical protein